MSVALDRDFLFKILERPCREELLFATVEHGVAAWQGRNSWAASGH
jgi:hypothetical protein